MAAAEKPTKLHKALFAEGVKFYRAPALTPPMIAQLFSDRGLPSGPTHVLRARTDCSMPGRYELLSDDIPMRSHLTVSEVLEVAAFARASFMAGW